MRTLALQCFTLLLALATCLPVAAANDDPPDTKPVAPPNVKEILRQLGRGLIAPTFPDRDDPGDKPSNPRAAGAKDYIDARAPRDLPLEALWTNARTALDGGDWKRGVEWMQKLLDMQGDAVIRTGNDRWESLRAVAQTRLSAAPRDVRADYERQFGGLAQQQLVEAHRTGSTEKLVEVATRFLHTRAGAEAANLLAAAHFDRGEFSLAVRLFREIDASGADLARDPRWRLKAALAAREVEPSTTKAFLDPLLAPTGPPTIDVAGRALPPREAWRQLPLLSTTSDAVLHDWLQRHGTAARVGSTPAGEPLLQPEWWFPLSAQPAIREHIDNLLNDLEDQSITAIFAAEPVAVGDCIAFRDLRGVRVVSASTGQVLWESVAGLSPEQILLGQPLREANTTSVWRLAAQRGGLDDDYFGQAAEFHPLASLLFRDATVGLLSSDGEQLFALEDVAVLTRNHAGYQWDDRSDEGDPYGAVWNSNRLAAYDLATGRVKWTAGGVAADEVVQPSLAGAFFLGVPVAVDDELFVIATQGDEIRLWSLDAQTGRAQWSQLLAYSDTKIDLDIARRWVSAPIAAAQGIVVCPTTVGWLVAVDRTRRSLLWAHRYLPPAADSQDDPGAQFLPQQGLNEQWSAASPIVSGQSVVFAPPDGDELICLNVMDGGLRWKQPRGNGVYLAGVHAGKVLVVEASGVQAYALETGKSVWSSAWDELVRPTGRGVISGGRFVVPLSSRELWSLEVATGEVVERLPLPDGEPALGNLVKAQGRWFSLGAKGLTAFGERDRVVSEIAARLKQNPNDADALLRDAEIRLLDRDVAAAEQSLRRLATTLSQKAEQRRRAAWWEIHSSRIGTDAAQGEAALTELTRLAHTPEERLLVAVWRADQLAAQEDQWAAFQQLWQTAVEDGPEWAVRPDAPDVRVQRRAWLAGRLADLWSGAPDTPRRKVDEFLFPQIDQAENVTERISLAELCDFHPAGARLWWQIAQERAAIGNLAHAETILARLSHHADRSIAAESAFRLARLWVQFDLGDDARRLLTRHRFAADSLSDGRRWSDAARTVLTELPADAHAVSRPSSTPAAKWEARQTPTTHAPPMQELAPPLDLPSWQRFSIQLEPQEQRVTFQSRSSGLWRWLAPLKSGARGDDHSLAPARFVDHRLFVLSRDVLHCLSPLERKVVWTRTLSHADPFDRLQALDRTPRPLIGPSDDSVGDRWSIGSDRLAVANHRYLCVLGRRELTVLDPLNGDEVWKLTGVPPLASVFGSEGVVYVFNDQREPPHAEAFRAADGKPLAIPKLGEKLPHVLALRGDDLILLEQQQFLGLDLFAGKTFLRRWNPLRDQEVWKLELPPRSHVGMAGDKFAIVVGPSSGKNGGAREVAWIDLDDGSQHKLASAPLGAGDSGFTPLLDEDRIYIVANSFARHGYHYGDNLPSIPVHGRVAAWDRRTGELLWQREVLDQNLVLDRFVQNPALVFLSRSWKQQGNASHTTLSLLALDKRTGQPLYESTSPSAFSGFHGLVVRAFEPSVELQSYNLKLRLGPARP